TRVYGARLGTMPIDTTHGFVVSSIEDVLVELVPRDITGPDFVLSGEVQYRRQANVQSWAGFYYSHNPTGDPEGPNHTFVRFGFQESSPQKMAAGPNEQIGKYGLWMAHWVNPDTPWVARSPIPTQFHRPFRTPLQLDKDEKPWRQLTIRVTRPTVTATFG